ncbi:MAG: flagellar M-ring protein FliF [Deltaproteobacteria bacterium HGW-Deltaproteobacteria-14]|jgi:flagellar M-ring protein FliF|nr:MAG: flagellar M-ring protein FliF [Deltaproteobacteria bacterium HGW-Deltaproteobacteria-14]
MADAQGDSAQGARPGVAGLRQTFDALPKQRRWLILAIGGAVLAGLLFVAMGGASGESFRPVARGLQPEDLDAAVAAMEAKKIPYKLEESGTISVPEPQIHEARLALAVGTMPSGRSVGFELFDASDMGRSAFSEKVNYHRALEGELARTIRHIEGIERARVHLVMPAKRVFRDLDVEPSASVVIDLKPGLELGTRQAQAIRQLVAGAVERLKPNKVAIVDQYGSLVARPAGDGALGSAESFEQQVELEQQLEQRVVRLLEPVVGGGKVRAQVALTIDYSHVVETKETYDPEGQVVRSEREVTEKDQSSRAEGGVVGTAANLPRPANAGQGGQGSSSSKDKSDSIKNYDIDKTTMRRETPTPRIEKLSVAVLVDEALNADGTATVPRTPEEIAQYKALVSRAVGLDPTRGDKIEVVGTRFAAPEVFEDQPGLTATPAPQGLLDDPTMLIALGAGGLLLLGLVLFLLLRKKKAARVAPGSGVGTSLDLLIDDPAGPRKLTDSEEKRARIGALRERAVVLAREDLRRLGVVFERWFELDTKAAEAATAAAASKAAAASPSEPREEAA